MEIVVRAAVTYLFLWVLIRGMGKRELAEMSAFELVLLVTIGDLVQQGVTQEDFSLTGAFLATGTMALLVVFASLVNARVRRLRGVLEGHPVVVVRNGHVVDEVVRTERLTLDEIHQAARSQGIDDMRKVRWCILEPDGRFSFIEAHGGRSADEADDRKAS